MKSNLLVAVAAAVSGAVLGGVLVAWSAGGSPATGPEPRLPPPSATPVPGASAPASAATGSERAGDERRAEARQAAATEAGERADGTLIPAALLQWARTEVERGWRDLRPDAPPVDVVDAALRDYRRQLETLAHALGRRAAVSQNELDQKAALFAGGDGVALLAVLRGDEPEVKGFVASERFVALFAPRGGGSTVDGTRLERGARVADGAVVAFPAGVFAVHDLARGNAPYPADVTVRGAGMDATLLVLDAQRAASPMLRFAIEDCTVFADNAITDVRSHPAILALRRVRVVGFDCGAGSAVAFYLSKGVAMSAIDCRFEGGYGRAPQSYANLARVNGACLVRFERCLFDTMSLDDIDGSGGALFGDCTMRELLREPRQGPTYRNCSITVLAVEKRWDGDHRRRDLNALFPQWRERLQGR